jgi:hypothetical protein
MRAAISGPAVRAVQGWPPAGRRAVGAGRGLGYTIPKSISFLTNFERQCLDVWLLHVHHA